MDKEILEFTHFNDAGRSKMVDVSEKKSTTRVAVAKGAITMKKETLQKIIDGQMKKGDVLGVAQIAGIMGVKRTADLIPMCHNIFISGSDIDFKIDEVNSRILIEATVKNSGQTGVEMEALMAVSVAALTIYDMCKAVDKEMTIESIYLAKKTGGKSGEFINPNHQ
ncbi:cyclic pyranopterin monophosphate synthase MoaC [Acetobacterium carbinolicum]|jgi:cyclic pyranopterin phosphate synthase|uniref:cyclic pyranopterin monophosphate synthase MoaC n=1 Tax=Acetobacterium TaxID=33951 RepID=UPI000DBEB3FE|nr:MULTISPECIES: cyclic pyranopterin monophosphate synthase MoaC [unclassified Acetobacterium]AWW28295.1 cyclic pyranopterin monophosphate synthase MoaC [Acetobacterium sp. KB-1]MDZ5725036.1 cyclic pyranopterin monophosphate synthase MoaC [Acetobacterium sp. K1/6]